MDFGPFSLVFRMAKLVRAAGWAGAISGGDGSPHGGLLLISAFIRGDTIVQNFEVSNGFFGIGTG